MGKILGLIILFDLIAVTIALLMGETPGQYFDEGQPMTWLSVAHLLAVYRISWNIFLYKTEGNFVWMDRKSPQFILKGWKSQNFLWFCIALGFFYLSLDELLLIHENIDTFIHWIFGMKETLLTDRIDDIVVGLYGLGGLAVLFYFREELKKYRKVLPLLTFGFFIFCLSVVLDIITNQEDILVGDLGMSEKLYFWLSGMEDAIKIIAEGVFVAVFYRCFEITKFGGPQKS
jgi:hypothetical protein